MHEVETKVLNIDAKEISQKLAALGAEKVQDTKLIVDWYGPKGLTHNGDDPWFLRVRTENDKSELTWKGISNHIGQSRQTEEINFMVSSPERAGEFLRALNLEPYAHQEKLRTSFIYKDWRFDIDQYPGMPAFVEIEGKSNEHVAEAIKLLGLENNKTWNKGERMLVQDEYKLNWFEMKF
jgi:adenylate cyclase class 2